MTEHTSPHVIPQKVYLGVGAALLLFTVITVAVSYVYLGSLNIVIALGIATCMAKLVAFFFMHLYYDHKFYFFVFSTSLFFLTVLITMTLFDTLRRGDIYAFKEVPITEHSEIYERSLSEQHKSGYPLQSTLAAGKALFEATCGNCHSIEGINGLRKPMAGLGEEFIYEFIGRLEYTRYEMEAFTGTDEERRLLAQYLLSEIGSAFLGGVVTGKEIFDTRCGFCHTKDGDIQPIFDAFYGSTYEDIIELIPLLPELIETMVPWLGTDEEIELLAEYILSWYSSEPGK